MSMVEVARSAAPRRGGPVADRAALVLSAVLLGVGFVALIVASVFHPGGVDPNDHPDVFAEYARGAGWTADHLGFFAATAITIAGLLVLVHVLDVPAGMPRLVARFGVVCGSAALALTAVRFAIDGVVLKRAVDAWAGAPAADKASRFASAETVRWTEEAVVSYQSFLLGLTLILLAALIVRTARLPRPFGYLLALGGIAYLLVGWIVGASGFAPGGAIPTYVAQVSQLVWSGYLVVIVWRMPRPASRRVDADRPGEPASRGAS
jgi:hypothetical protein